MDASCPICGAPVTRKGEHGPLATYCTTVCRRRADYLRRKASGHLAARLATRKEADRAERVALGRTCQHCAAPLGAARRDAKFCSRKCSRDGQPTGCATRGCVRPLRAKGLCNYCYRKARGEKQLWTDKRRDAYHRRRAQKSATETRPVLLSEIRERDASRCHLCRKKVSAKPYPHPLSASLDHVIPLSLDGEHIPENVRLAHLRCNVEKGNGGGNEQLLLIG